MNDTKYKALKLENQLCFPLYAAFGEMASRTDRIRMFPDLTYTRYISMTVLRKQCS